MTSAPTTTWLVDLRDLDHRLVELLHEAAGVLDDLVRDAVAAGADQQRQRWALDDARRAMRELVVELGARILGDGGCLDDEGGDEEEGPYE